MDDGRLVADTAGEDQVSGAPPRRGHAGVGSRMCAAVAVASVLAFAAVACGGGSSGKDDLCQGSAAMQTALTSIAGLDPATATADDIQQARYDVTQATDDIQKGAADLDSAESVTVLNATNILNTALGAIAASVPPAQAVQAAQVAATAWTAATSAALTSIGCST